MKQRGQYLRKRVKTTSGLVGIYLSGRPLCSLAEAQIRLTGNGSLPCPDDRGTAAINADLSIKRGDVIAHGVLREVESLAHLEVAVALTYESKNLSLAGCQEIKVKR